jgi:hypothetical protein
MPAQIYERSDVSGGTVSVANPEANHRCEGWTLYGGVESWQGSHTSTAPPALESERSEYCGEPVSRQRSERKSSWGVGMGGVLPC